MSRQTAVSCTQDISATITALVIPCQVILSGLYVLQLDRIINCFSLLASFKTLSNMMRAGPKGGGLQISSRSILPSTVCMVLSTMGLNFKFYEANKKTKNNSNFIYCLRSLLNSHEQQLKDISLTQHWVGFRQSVVLQKTLSPHMA